LQNRTEDEPPRSSAIPWTAEQLTEGIAKALKDRQIDAIEPLMRLLVVVDPRQAERVWETLQLGVLLAAQGGQR